MIRGVSRSASCCWIAPPPPSRRRCSPAARSRKTRWRRSGRLARLVEQRKAAEALQPRRSWLLVVLGAGTLLIASVLLFARVPETEVELEIGATEVSFSLPSQQVLFENMSLSSLGVSGLRRVTLPGGSRRGTRGSRPHCLAPDEDAAVRLEALEDGARRGTIGIAAIVPGAGTEVWLRRADSPASTGSRSATPRALCKWTWRARSASPPRAPRPARSMW